MRLHKNIENALTVVAQFIDTYTKHRKFMSVNPLRIAEITLLLRRAQIPRNLNEQSKKKYNELNAIREHILFPPRSTRAIQKCINSRRIFIQNDTKWWLQISFFLFCLLASCLSQNSAHSAHTQKETMNQILVFQREKEKYVFVWIRVCWMWSRFSSSSCVVVIFLCALSFWWRKIIARCRIVYGIIYAPTHLNLFACLGGAARIGWRRVWKLAKSLKQNENGFPYWPNAIFGGIFHMRNFRAFSQQCRP